MNQTIHQFFFRLNTRPRKLFAKGNIGFTLIELLVVIALIAILVALSYAGTRSAMELAKRMQCASNLRQIAAALHSFANDNDGLFPQVGFVIPLGTKDPKTGKPSWMEQIDPYTGANRKIFLCPSNKTVSPNNYYLSAWAPYVANNNLSDPSATRQTSPMRLSLVTHPSAMILVADCTAKFGEPDADKDDCAGKVPGPAWADTLFHQGYSNVAFVDGHVAATKQFDKNTMTARYEGPGYEYNSQAP